MSLAQSPGLQLTAATGRPPYERRRHPRSHEDNRLRGRMIEFASVVLIATIFAGFAFTMVEQALANPFAAVRSALSN